jgi:hypothetical protein
VLSADEAGRADRKVVRCSPPGHDRRTGRPEARILSQDRRAQLLELGAGIDTELLHKALACVVVGAQRLSLPACAVESEHELAPEPFPQRVFGHQCLDLPDHLEMSAQSELGVQPIFADLQPKVVESRCLHSGDGTVGQVDQRLSSPQREALAQVGVR